MHRLIRWLTPQTPHVERGQSTERPAPSRVCQRGATGQLRFDPPERWQIRVGMPDELCIDVDLRQDPDQSTGPARALECPRRRYAEYVPSGSQATASVEQGLQACVHRPTLPWSATLAGVAVDSRSTCG